MIPNGNIQRVQGFPASVFLIVCLNSSWLYLLWCFLLKPRWSVFQINNSLFECTHRKSVLWPAGKKCIFKCVVVIAFLTCLFLWVAHFVSNPLELCSLQSLLLVMSTWWDEILMPRVYLDFFFSGTCHVYLSRHFVFAQIQCQAEFGNYLQNI